MKKILVILLALCAMTFAFAADAKPALTFGAYGDITATLDQDTGKTAYAVYTETYFSYAASDMGFAATTVGGANPFDAFRNYSFYYNFFDGKMKVLAGKLRETGSARLTSIIDGNGFSTRLANVQEGFMVTGKPVDGLVLSAFVPLTGAVIGTDFGAANIGAAYLVKDVANIVAGYRLGNKELYVGADVKAIKDVTLRVGFKNVTTTNSVFLTAGTTMDKLTVNLDGELVINTATKFGAKVQGEYAVSDMVAPGVKVSFDNGDGWYGNNGLDVNPYCQFNFAAGDLKVGFDYNAGTSTWSIPIDFELSY